MQILSCTLYCFLNISLVFLEYENLFKSMSFKVPQPALKKKFFPSDDTFKECFDYGVEFAQYIK